jgi:hypothetical protein
VAVPLTGSVASIVRVIPVAVGKPVVEARVIVVSVPRAEFARVVAKL